MIWYIIIATVFLFKYGHVSATNTVPADLRSYKYICTIYRDDPENQVPNFICIGVLVGFRFAITPASCVSGFNNDNEMYIMVNTSIRDQGIRYKVIGITFNPRTNGPHTNIAILKIATTVDKGETVRSIHMPNIDNISPNRKILVISYGVRSEGQSSPTLQKTRTTILDIQNPPINTFVASNQENNMILFFNPDLGAPAVLNRTVIGLLSSRTGLPNAKATFLNLFVLKDFVVANTQRILYE